MDFEMGASASVRDTQIASVAFEALNALHRPVGVVDGNGRVILANELFYELFCGKSCSKEPSLCIETIGNLNERVNQNSLIHRDGRMFRLKTAAIAEGLLVFGEEVTQQATDPVNANVALAYSESAAANRLSFRARLMQILQTRDPANDAVAVLVVDLSKFKNPLESSRDTPALMNLVTDRLRSTLAPEDFLARVGDDEFFILQSQSPQPQSATALAARLVDSLAVDGHFHNLDACVGVYIIPAMGKDCGAACGGNCDEILNNAFLALSQAKQDGPNRFRVYKSAVNIQCDARRSLEFDLRRALASQELELVYQPQINLESGRVTAFEALLRWRHPRRGVVSPADFIPLAEDIGLISPIGEWVLRRACSEAVTWPAGQRVAVNVSAVQFRDANLCEQVSAALADSGLDPGRLELEITESVLLGDHASVLRALHRLREMGVLISMDDFGTGYSSLSYLHSFPFDKIKIDQSFIRGAIDEVSSTAIVRAIAILGQSLGMTTTAEGVETEAQMNRVSEAGCTDIQGYLISKPLQPESVTSFLQSHLPGLAAE